MGWLATYLGWRLSQLEWHEVFKQDLARSVEHPNPMKVHSQSRYGFLLTKVLCMQKLRTDMLV